MDNHGFQSDGTNGNQLPFTISKCSQGNDNNFLVEVNARSKLFKQPTFYRRLSLYFLLLAIIFLIIMIVFIILYFKPKPKICTTNECLRTAANYLSSMNFSVNPCDNFYEFACGKWSEEHPNHGWWSSFSSFTTIVEKVAIATMHVLSVDDSEDEPKALHNTRKFYRACMNLDALDELGVAAVYPILDKIGVPIVPNFMTLKDSASFQFNWMKADASAKKILLMDIFIGATVGPNIFNGSENVLYVGQVYQTSPLPSPARYKNKYIRNGMVKDVNYEEDTVKDVIRTVNRNIIQFVINAVVENSTGAEADDDLLLKAADAIIDISEDIDYIVANTTDPDIEEEDTIKISIEKLEREIRSEVNDTEPNFLMTYLNYLFNGTNVTFNAKTDLIFVTELDVVFLKMIMKYIKDVPDVNIELYVWWTSVYSMIINTSTDIAEYITKQMNIFTSNNKVLRSRSLECALLTNNYLGYAVSYALADKSFPEVTKPKVERMVSNLKEAFVTHVNEISWMDSRTKKATLEKSKEMITFIGYPDWLFKPGELDKHYREIKTTSTTHLENMINVIIDHAIKNLKSLRKPHKRDWYSEPIEVNAFNSFSDNAINVPMAILNFPMYHLGLEVLNYGSIGSILGHELTHGFDNIGRKHDKYGNLVQWWTNQTIEAFQSFTDCFIQQYDNFTIPGVEGHINGKNTLGENLADNGGLNQAFSAYKSYTAKHGEESILPGFENYNSFQLFFIAYASIWCETTTAEDLENQFEYDEHCPNLIRVLGTLQNSADFAREFHCPAGSTMNPIKKCKIW